MPGSSRADGGFKLKVLADPQVVFWARDQTEEHDDDDEGGTCDCELCEPFPCESGQCRCYGYGGGDDPPPPSGGFDSPFFIRDPGGSGPLTPTGGGSSSGTPDGDSTEVTQVVKKSTGVEKINRNAQAIPAEDECEAKDEDEEEGGRTGTDPVDLNSGEFYLTVEDLRIKGRGLDFILGRTYRSRSYLSSSIGEGWDWSYEIYLDPVNLPANTNLRLHDGSGRVITYREEDTNRWLSSDHLSVLTLDPADGSYTLSFESGGTWTFNALAVQGQPHTPGAGYISASTDRNGNTLTFTYEDLPSGVWFRLATITDTLGRDIEFDYHPVEEWALTSVTDFAGRMVTYDYYWDGEAGGDWGALRSVTTPAVVGTPNGNDFPQGKTTSYTYTKKDPAFPDALGGNLLTITDGRGNDPNDASSTGPWLVNVYSDQVDPSHPNHTQDPASPWFDRVVRQQWGGDWVDLVYEEVEPQEHMRWTRRKTIVNDRVGNVTEYYWNEKGQGVLERRFTGRAPNAMDHTTGKSTAHNRPVNPLRPEDPEYFETRRWFDNLGLVTRVHNPDGNITENVYVHHRRKSAPRHQWRNLIERHRSSGIHETPADRVKEVLSYADEFGSCGCGNDAVIHHATYRYAVNSWSLTGVTAFDYDDNGNREQVRQGLGNTAHDYEYDPDTGQLSAEIWPANGQGHRRRDEYHYYDETSPMHGYRRSKVVDVGGFNLETLYEYDAVGNVVRKRDPEGNWTDYVVNERDQVVRRISPEVTDGSGIRYETDYFYDAGDNLVRVDVQNVDEAGVVGANTHFTTKYELDELGEVLVERREVKEGHEIVVRHHYDGNRNRTRTEKGEATSGQDPDNVTEWRYDERNLLFEEIRAPGHAKKSTTRFSYDGNGNIASRTTGVEDSGPPRTTTYEHDALNRLVAETDPMGNVRRLGYDSRGQVTSEIVEGELVDVEGGAQNVRLYEARYFYDQPLGWRRRVEVEHFDPATQQPIGDGLSVTEFTFASNGAITSVKDDRDNTTTFTQDTANRPHVLTDAAGNTETYLYDGNGNVRTITYSDVSDQFGTTQVRSQSLGHDNLQRVVQVTDDDIGAVTQHAHDSRGNLTRTIDELGNVVRQEYDGLNRPTVTRRELREGGVGAGALLDEIVTVDTWDDSSRLWARSDGNENVTTYVYDALDRVKSIEFADGTEDEVLRDANDNIAWRADANGTAVVSDHDLNDRLATRSVLWPGTGVSLDTTAESYEYDGLGRVVRAQDDDSVVERSYDSLGNLLSETLNGHVTSYVHDGVGNKTQVTYPGGRVVSWEPDALNRPKQQSGTEVGDTLRYDYIGRNRVERRELGNGTEDTFGFDASGRTTSFTSSLGGVAFTSRSYVWDLVDNKLEAHDLLPGGISRHFTYDSVRQLVGSEQRASDGSVLFTREYAHDGGLNREEVLETGTPALTYTLDAATPPGDALVNQYTTTPTGTQRHDDAGNLTVVDEGAATERRLVYDFRNRMVEHLDVASGVTTSYAYDPFGRRFRTIVNEVGSYSSTVYVYDDWQVIEERDGAVGGVQATYVYGRYVDEPLNMERGGERYFFHQDDLFSVMAVTDASGAVVERYEYDDYGVPTILDPAGTERASSAIGNPFLFSGKRYDGESGFYYSRHRYLDPTTGRFTTRDPLGIWADPLNRGNGHAYAGNNPWSMVDPYGTRGWSFVRGVASGLGTGVFEAIGGLLEAAWDTVTDLPGTIAGIFSGIESLVSELKNGNLREVLEASFPSLARLLNCWEGLTDFERGELIGQVIGEYGFEAVTALISGVGLLKVTQKLGKLRKLKGALRGKPGCSFAAGTLVLVAGGYIPIEDIQVGDRVLTNADGNVVNSELNTAVDPRTWRAVRLVVVDEEGGDVYELEVLRPLSWLEERGLAVVGPARFKTPGTGAPAAAWVLAIEDCPEVQQGAGSVVIATVAHRSDSLRSVSIVGDVLPVHMTDHQRVWSESRSGWIRAAQISDGESLGRAGGTAPVSAGASGVDRVVYDFQLELGHVYHAGQGRLVVHNCPVDGVGDLDPRDFAGKSPTEIDALAKQKGLTPKGPDPKSGKGAYVDTDGKTQRILCHGCEDPPHMHVNNAAGERLDIDGKVVAPESPEAHLPIGVDP